MGPRDVESRPSAALMWPTTLAEAWPQAYAPFFANPPPLLPAAGYVTGAGYLGCYFGYFGSDRDNCLLYRWLTSIEWVADGLSGDFLVLFCVLRETGFC